MRFPKCYFLDKMRIFAPVFFPYLSARMNMDPLWSRQVPLLLIWFLEIFKGCGNPEWYQVPSQLGGNWHCCCGVVKPILINAKHMTVRLSKLSMFSCFPSSSSPEIDSLKASYKKKHFKSLSIKLSIKDKCPLPPYTFSIFAPWAL